MCPVRNVTYVSGRALYAGTRAILVTNWSVHSASARELVTDLFRRQATDRSITRGEALRQAMIALLDGPGYVDAQGGAAFSYAHPLFWAPYSIIGDGAVLRAKAWSAAVFICGVLSENCPQEPHSELPGAFICRLQASGRRCAIAAFPFLKTALRQGAKHQRRTASEPPRGIRPRSYAAGC
jgi:hypothetical protein